MKLPMKRSLLRHLAVFACISILVMPLSAQEPASPPAKPKTQVQKPDTANRLTIEVKGGENSVPVENASVRSEEHTSELQSLAYLVCRLLLEKKKKTSCKTRHGHIDRR